MRDLFSKLPLIAAAVSATALTGSDIDNQATNLESEAKKVGTHATGSTYGSNVELASSQDDSCSFYFGAGATLLQPVIEGTDYVINISGTAATRLETTPIYVKPTAKWGLDIEAGYKTPLDGFDGKIAYTFVDNTTSSEARDEVGSVITQTRAAPALAILAGTPPLLFSLVQSAKASVLYKAHGITADLGKNYFISSNLSVRSSYGVQTLWSELKETVEYEGRAGSSILNAESAKVEDQTKFSGIGPRIGTESKWHLGNGFSIFGDAAAALAYGKFTVSHTEETDAAAALSENNKYSTEFKTIVPVSDMSVGLSFDKVIEEYYHISASLGYVARYNFRQNQRIKLVTDVVGPVAALTDFTVSGAEIIESSDIAVHGLVLSVSIDF